MKKISLLLVIACLVFNLTANSQIIYLTVEGAKQGKFQGESKSKFADKMDVTGFVQEITSPRDAASGMAAGRRMHQPLIILKPSGAASPQFFSALTGNEQLKKVSIEFYSPDPSGKEMLTYTITLENAHVSAYKQFVGPLDNEKFNPANNLLFDEIRLSFQKIIVEHNQAKTMATDDASARN